jgi:hypothetical protein
VLRVDKGSVESSTRLGAWGGSAAP